MIGLSMKLTTAKANFFDKELVKRKLDAAARRNLSKFGAFVRQGAKTSLKYKTGVSPAGRPPHIHKTGMRKKTNKKTGVVKVQAVSPLREFIYFVWDAAAQAVVVGPVQFGGAKGGSEALSALEHGGQTTIHGKQPRRVTVAARPFMGPAAARELPKLPPLWRDSIR